MIPYDILERMTWYSRIALFLLFVGFSLGISVSHKTFSPPKLDKIPITTKKIPESVPENINIYGVVREIDSSTKNIVLEILDPYRMAGKILLRTSFADQKDWTVTEKGNILVRGTTTTLSLENGFAGRFILRRRAGILSIDSTPFQVKDVTPTP